METIIAYWRRLRRNRLAWNLTLIAAILVGLTLAAHLTMQVATRHGARRTVPDFSGIRFDDAQRIARERSLELHINDSLFVPAYDGGIVLDQLPEGGTEVKPGRTVYVTINSFRQKMVEVPYVAGRSLRQAKNMLEIAGLQIEQLVYRPDIATNYVLEEAYDGRKISASTRLEAEMGSGVTLYVGVESGHAGTVVPQTVGLPLHEARSRLWEQGLNIGKVLFDEGINLLNQKEARVYLQSPSGERSAALGSKVDLRLTLDRKKLSDHRTTAEKQARKSARERVAAERERADSLERAHAGHPAPAGGATNNDEFFDR
ncbi:PASTA domain-containing protein [uncultured Alistipes sp.]|uniref:PASTA domain-containing protein n=1 Tax=uncultured Alistipes sp. TaxID=538949 RepID=UPI002619EFC8|nr:PASTA domain-containing protein [uncultured Alistipes sp.]